MPALCYEGLLIRVFEYGKYGKLLGKVVYPMIIMCLALGFGSGIVLGYLLLFLMGSGFR